MHSNTNHLYAPPAPALPVEPSLNPCSEPSTPKPSTPRCSISFDVRGESDLRDPSSSTIAVVSLSPGVALPRPDAATPAATPATSVATSGATPETANATSSSTPAAAAAASVSSPAEAAAAAAAPGAAAGDFETRGSLELLPLQPWCYELPREGQPQQEPFQRVIVSARPEALMLCARQSGHYKVWKGCVG